MNKPIVLSFVVLVLFFSGCAGPKIKGKSWEDLAGPKHNSPGVKLTFKELERKKIDGFTSVTYELVPEGFPPDKDYEVWIYDLGRFLKKEGIVGPVKAPKRGTKFTLNFHKFIKGEWFEVAFISSDRTVKAFAKAIPSPIEAKDGTCHIWLEVVYPGKAFAVFGEGFEPGEVVTSVSRSNGETMESKNTISQNGELPLNILLPAAIEKNYQSSFSVIGNSCEVRINYEWGPPSLKLQ